MPTTRKPRVRLRRERVHVWVPQWHGDVETWASKFINANLWRCDKILSKEDLLQEAYIIFMKIFERYPRVSQPNHFISLFQTSFRNYIHDHSRYMQRKKLVHEDTTADVSELFTNTIGEVTHSGYLALLLDEMPEELKMALEALANQEPELYSKRQRGMPRENLNMKLRRILGFEDTFDFKGSLYSLLGFEIKPTQGAHDGQEAKTTPH